MPAFRDIIAARILALPSNEDPSLAVPTMGAVAGIEQASIQSARIQPSLPDLAGIVLGRQKLNQDASQAEARHSLASRGLDIEQGREQRLSAQAGIESVLGIGNLAAREGELDLSRAKEARAAEEAEQKTASGDALGAFLLDRQGAAEAGQGPPSLDAEILGQIRGQDRVTLANTMAGSMREALQLTFMRLRNRAQELEIEKRKSDLGEAGQALSKTSAEEREAMALRGSSNLGIYGALLSDEFLRRSMRTEGALDLLADLRPEEAAVLAFGTDADIESIAAGFDIEPRTSYTTNPALIPRFAEALSGGRGIARIDGEDYGFDMAEAYQPSEKRLAGYREDILAEALARRFGTEGMSETKRAEIQRDLRPKEVNEDPFAISFGVSGGAEVDPGALDAAITEANEWMEGVNVVRARDGHVLGTLAGTEWASGAGLVTSRKEWRRRADLPKGEARLDAYQNMTADRLLRSLGEIRSNIQGSAQARQLRSAAKAVARKAGIEISPQSMAEAVGGALRGVIGNPAIDDDEARSLIGPYLSRAINDSPEESLSWYRDRGRPIEDNPEDLRAQRAHGAIAFLDDPQVAEALLSDPGYLAGDIPAGAFTEMDAARWNAEKLPVHPITTARWELDQAMPGGKDAHAGLSRAMRTLQARRADPSIPPLAVMHAFFSAPGPMARARVMERLEDWALNGGPGVADHPLILFLATSVGIPPQ